MKRRATLFALPFLLLACSADDRSDVRHTSERSMDTARDSLSEVAGETPPADGVARLTPDGWGPLRIGMSRDEITEVAGPDARPDLVGGPEPDVCDEYRPAGAPEHMLLMLQRDTLTRITIMRESEVVTERGFGIGDDAADILEAYGAAAEESAHKYRDAPSAYITVWRTRPGGSRIARGIVYDIGDDGRVSLVHAGGESITYVEGCL